MAAKTVGLFVEPNHPVYGEAGDFGSQNDLVVDPATGSLAVAIDGEAIGQHIRQRLKFWSGESVLRPEAGVEWTRFILGRPPQEIEIAEAVIKAEILATPGVTEILEFEAYYDRTSRGLKIERAVIASVFDDLIEIQF